MFSPNETLEEIATENMKLLMAPFYEAEVLFKIMDNRPERVKMAHTFYLEYLKLMTHYDMLEKPQKKAWKLMYTEFFTPNKSEESVEEKQDAAKNHPMLNLAIATEDREAKIAAYRLKKQIEGNLDLLKDYKDEDAQRKFYKAQL
jgi:immunoglobulin-binding protein 1